MKILKGDTLEDQMKHADIILSRLNRRKRKVAKGLITPYPISSFADFPVDGIVLRYMFPVDGELLFGGMFVDQMPKEGVDITFDLSLANNTSRSESMFTKSNVFTVRPNIEIDSGSRLTVSVVARVEGSELSGIWTSLLWVPKVSELIVRKVLVDELDKLEKSEE